MIEEVYNEIMDNPELSMDEQFELISQLVDALKDREKDKGR